MVDESDKSKRLSQQEISNLLGKVIEKEPITITAEYLITTPMFIGDANQEATRILAASVKGALRFWWRALNWGKVRSGAESDEAALKLLHQREVEIFGGITTKEDEQKKKIEYRSASSFSLVVDQRGERRKINNWPVNGGNDGATYFAYGLLKTAEQEHRSAFEERQYFTVEARFIDDDKYKSIEVELTEAFKALGMFGGLGGRSRRAMGSVTLMTLNGENYQFRNKDSYLDSVKKVLHEYKDVPLAPYTALTKKTQYCVFASNSNVRQAVNITGLKYKKFRGNYKTNQNIEFGLPLAENYLEHRRSSPLIFHVQKTVCEQNHVIGIYMPASIFHHDDGYSHITGKHVLNFIQERN